MTRSICPAVTLSVIAVNADVPFPCRRPVSVEAPVPPFATVRSLVSTRVPPKRLVAVKAVDEA